MAMSSGLHKRLQAKQFLLTWARCPVLKESAMDQLRARFGDNIKYILVAQEIHKDGMTHLHSTLLLKERLDTRDFGIFEIMDGNMEKYKADVEVIRNINKTIAYCKKGPNWIDYGINPIDEKRETTRNKVQFVREHTIDEIINMNNMSIFEIRAAIQLRKMIEGRKRMWPSWKKREVYWFYGATGTGKTRDAVNMMKAKYQDSWKILGGDLRTFMIGYEGEPGVIFDDIRRGTMKFEYLLRILDGYPMVVNVKGTQVEWLAETIVITCPLKPEELYADPETRETWDHIDQLLRRIDEIREFPTSEQTEVLSYIPSGGSPGLPPATGGLF